MLDIYFFISPTCPACHKAKPVLQAFCMDNPLTVNVMELNVDVNVYRPYGAVTKTPTYQFAIDGHKVLERHGGLSREDLDAILKSALERG